jgi:phosphotransacetylase
MAVQEVQRFGLPPKVAFLSHSSYGSSKRASARKMREARDLFVAAHPRSNATASCTATRRWSPTSATPTWRTPR